MTELQYSTDAMRVVARTLVSVLERKHPYTHGHSERVSKYAELIARELTELTPEQVEHIAIGALVHDAGKVVVERHTLNNPSPHLDDDQVVELENHPHDGVQIIRKCGVPFPQEAIDCIHAHHESWDGAHDGDLRGYPLGRQGEAIPLAGRIVAVADTYDAMTTPRSYQKTLSQVEAIAALQSIAGKKLDPRIVSIFITKVVPSLDRRKS